MLAGERTLRSEQGAVFVQVGISIFVLMAFNVFVLDYGVMWVSRRQAQNAADAAALAGAVARGYDVRNSDDPDEVAADSASLVAAANLIWNEAGVPVVSHSCPAGVTGKCTRVDVHRNVEHGNPIDMLFGPILGITGQGVRATATAITANGNATDCLRPIALPGDWLDLQLPNNEFNFYDATGNPLSGGRDAFTPPNASQTGGSTILGNFGIVLNYDLNDTTTAPTTPITRGLVVPLSLPDGPGAVTFSQKMQSCNGQLVKLRETLPVLTGFGTPTASDITAELDTIWTQDPFPPLEWHPGRLRVDNSCAPGCAPISPRVIPVALFDPQRFQLGRALSASSLSPSWSHPNVGCPTESPCITVTNIAGFFIHCVSARPCDGSTTPHGHLLRYPGMIAAGAPTFVDDASWLVNTHLIR